MKKKKKKYTPRSSHIITGIPSVGTFYDQFSLKNCAWLVKVFGFGIREPLTFIFTLVPSPGFELMLFGITQLQEASTILLYHGIPFTLP
ncbi:hypothetical protein E2C01_092643 [Portunus trituberculatus]|uniref:Uncharacterized protein n=1 Tax=Portunus trituberculatus TaxID=210409 RepID=A0A5B7JMK3_PORTR|nr:hypothetical protein [Portunus trituberculatus]